MVAPTPVSALLHAVAVVKVGVFCIIRVVTGVFGVDLLGRLGVNEVLAWIAAFTVITSSLIALTQDNLKRRLAFSTIGQLAYIVLGAALITKLSLSGSVLHIAAHAVAKITLFFCAGAIYVASHKKNISEMSGLGRAMPWTFGAFGLAALGMIGAPPVGGFITKLYLLVGALDAGTIGILVVLIASTLLNTAYFAPVVYHAFFGKAPAGEHHHGEAPLAMLIPLCLTAVISVLVGIFPDFFMRFATAVLP